MKINSRLQAAEEAIDRIMSILNEFFKGGPQSMKEVQSEVSGLADDVNILKNMLQVINYNVIIPLYGVFYLFNI